VQTYSPEHPAIVFAARHDFDGFARQELELRRELRYPPFAELIYLAVAGRVESAVVAAAARYAELAGRVAGTEVLGPAPAPVARGNGEWRYRIALKTADGTLLRRELREMLAPLAAAECDVRLAINVDP